MNINQTESAAEKFLGGYNCAQSVLFALADRNNISDDVLLKISTGFGGGMAREQEVCGAVTGGIMALGLRFGRGVSDEKINTDTTYVNTRKLIAEFKQLYGSIICKEILDGIDLQTEDGQKKMREENFAEKKCLNCVKSVVEIYKQF